VTINEPGATNDLGALMTLRVQGIASPERAGAALGVSPNEARSRLASLVSADLASQRTGRLSGFTLTPSGLERFEKLLAEEGLRNSESLCACYDRFMTIDPVVKQLSSKWQLEKHLAVIAELAELHDKVRVCMRKIAACAPRYEPYLQRLDAVLERLVDGDESAFTKPLAESYHQVWWELHQDLLLTLGREREE
jgi:hypothetical protein